MIAAVTILSQLMLAHRAPLGCWQVRLAGPHLFTADRAPAVENAGWLRGLYPKRWANVGAGKVRGERHKRLMTKSSRAGSMLSDEWDALSFRFSVSELATGKEAGPPNRMIEFEGFVGVLWTGQSALQKAPLFLAFLVISSQKVAILRSFPFVMLR